jgi:hypothetical protein
MSLRDDLNRVLEPIDPATGDIVSLVDNWSVFLAESRGLRELAQDRAGWVQHDTNGNVIKSALTTPESYKQRWWPEGDVVAVFRKPLEPTFPGTEYKSVSTYVRQGSTLTNLVRFGYPAQSNHVIRCWFDLGIRALIFDVHGEARRDLIVERYTREGHQIKWTRDNDPDLYHMTVTLDSKPELHKRGRHGA